MLIQEYVLVIFDPEVARKFEISFEHFKNCCERKSFQLTNLFALYFRKFHPFRHLFPNKAVK